MSRSARTDAVHAGEQHVLGGAVSPIVRSTVHAVPPGTAYNDIRYPRLSNLENHVEVAQKIAALEGGEEGLATSSGMAAISTSLLALLRPGDHVLVQAVTYGATHALFHSYLPSLGIEVTDVDAQDPSAWKAAIRPCTKAIYAETISNPLLRVTDIDAVVTFARDNGLVSFLDHTFATPILRPAAAVGIDIVLHSATKYLGGHSDVCAGTVVASAQHIAAIKGQLQLLGGSLDPEAAWLLARGMKTLPLRVAAQCEGALQIATALQDHVTVHYPGLPRHPDHRVAERSLEHFGAMVALDLGDEASAEAFLARLRLFFVGPSLGGVESLATRPAASSHAKLTAQQRATLGIGDGLVRLSIGIEDPLDLLADLEQALGLEGAQS